MESCTSGLTFDHFSSAKVSDLEIASQWKSNVKYGLRGLLCKSRGCVTEGFLLSGDQSDGHVENFPAGLGTYVGPNSPIAP